MAVVIQPPCSAPVVLRQQEVALLLLPLELLRSIQPEPLSRSRPAHLPENIPRSSSVNGQTLNFTFSNLEPVLIITIHSGLQTDLLLHSALHRFHLQIHLPELFMHTGLLMQHAQQMPVVIHQQCSVQIVSRAAPPNDLCTAAIPITCGSATVVQRLEQQ
jgi:hypothetical protein